MPQLDPTSLSCAVVGDDGRAGGDCALAAAAFLRQQLKTQLHVVHAIDVPDLTEVGNHPELLLPIRAEMAERAEAWLAARAGSALPDVTEPSLQVAFGRPRDALLRAARSLAADVIVIGGHTSEFPLDVGGTQRAVFGNQVADVWSQPSRFAGIERILVACDPDSTGGRVIDVVRDLAQRLAAAGSSVPVVAVHCWSPIAFVEPSTEYGLSGGAPSYVVEAIQSAAETEFRAWCGEQDFGSVTLEARFEVGPTAATLVEFQSETDLLVLGTRGHTGAAAALVGGTAYGVLKRARGPVLTVRGADS